LEPGWGVRRPSLRVSLRLRTTGSRSRLSNRARPRPAAILEIRSVRFDRYTRQAGSRCLNTVGCVSVVAGIAFGTEAANPVPLMGDHADEVGRLRACRLAGLGLRPAKPIR
jgi:hypothetical protein